MRSKLEEEGSCHHCQEVLRANEIRPLSSTTSLSLEGEEARRRRRDVTLLPPPPNSNLGAELRPAWSRSGSGLITPRGGGPRSSRCHPPAHRFVADSTIPDASRAREGVGVPGQRRCCSCCLLTCSCHSARGRDEGSEEKWREVVATTVGSRHCCWLLGGRSWRKSRLALHRGLAAEPYSSVAGSKGHTPPQPPKRARALPRASVTGERDGASPRANTAGLQAFPRAAPPGERAGAAPWTSATDRASSSSSIAGRCRDNRRRRDGRQ
jgi:hypothetical protein